MKCQTIFKLEEKKRPTIEACVRCGSEIINEYEFGIVCSNCSTGLYFGIGEVYSQK